MEKLGSVHVPGDWSHFRSMGEGVLGVIALPDEVVKLTDQEIHCVVMDVQYDDYYRKLRSYDGPVRYWVDSESNLIRKCSSPKCPRRGGSGVAGSGCGYLETACVGRQTRAKF
jgi:hypothetical protein